MLSAFDNTQRRFTGAGSIINNKIIQEKIKIQQIKVMQRGRNETKKQTSKQSNFKKGFKEVGLVADLFTVVFYRRCYSLQGVSLNLTITKASVKVYLIS